MEHLLEVKEFHYCYGQIHAVKGLNFYIDQGEIVTLIGANGAGKSTTINAIAGLIPGAGVGGEILYRGKNIAGKSGHAVSKMGIMAVVEGRHVFSQLTVQENLLMGAYGRRDKKAVQQDIESVYALFPKLRERSGQAGGTLSGGEQQMLAIARALVNRPELILLDEPSLGLAPMVMQEIFHQIRRINEESNTTILLVEQNSKAALRLAHRGYVLQNGEIALRGDCAELQNDPLVRKAYLGIAE